MKGLHSLLLSFSTESFLPMNFGPWKMTFFFSYLPSSNCGIFFSLKGSPPFPPIRLEKPWPFGYVRRNWCFFKTEFLSGLSGSMCSVRNSPSSFKGSPVLEEEVFSLSPGFVFFASLLHGLSLSMFTRKRPLPAFFFLRRVR